MSSIEQAVINKITERAKMGKEKYGVTMDRNDLTHKQWLIHAQEEAMDSAIYLQKLIELETVKEGDYKVANNHTWDDGKDFQEYLTLKNKHREMPKNY